MKILQINSSLNTGSTGRIADEIGNKFINEGHESYVAFKKIGPNGSKSKKVKVGNSLDKYLHGLKTRLFDLHGFGSKKATHKLVRKIDAIDPDVIGLHNLHGYYINIEILFDYLKKVQKPIIWTLHDCWPFTGHCSFFDYVSCEKWKSECHDCPLTDKYPASWFIDNSNNNFHSKRELFNGFENMTIVTPSHWLKKLGSQSILSDYPIKVIHNGIDLNRFKPVDSRDLISKYHLNGKKVLLGVASVWDRRKGLNFFFELSKSLDDNFRIILIGLSEKILNELPENIIGIRRTENIDELVSFYNAADVYINPTLVDNFPTTNIEALACGTPVITFNTGGSPEAIDERTGYVVSQGDIGNLYQTIINFFKSNDLTDYKRKCRERSIRKFNKEDRYEEYLDLYYKMLDQ